MKTLEILQGFGKGQKKHKSGAEKNAIIYTRVSSKEQTENLSLEVQLKGCEQFAIKNSLTVMGRFGGTYESAQTDERNEFKRMVSFAKNYKEGISYIIVYSLERFSRTGENAIWLSRQLRELGIAIMSVTQPIDTSNPSGVLQQNILFLFSQYDNDLRRQKSVAGMKEKLLRGEWVGGTPTGYSYDRSDLKEQKIVINEKGKLVKRAFELKAFDKLTNTEIASRMSMLGLKVCKKRVSDMLKNPFYCGFLSHTLLEGQVVKGKHKPIVSEDLFFEANEVLKMAKLNISGYKQKKGNENFPLKQFVICAQCGTPLTGYLVKSKGLYYYKCNRIGCKCNRNADHLHNLFKKLLSNYQVKQEYTPVLQDMLIETYYNQKGVSEFDIRDVKTKATELTKKLETVEERFAFGEISREIHEKVSLKLNNELKEIEEQLNANQYDLSNPEKIAGQAVEILSNLVDLWDSNELQGQLELQNLMFPKGISYDRKIDDYRTIETNFIAELTHSFSVRLKEKKSGQTNKKIDLSALVALAGIEPAS